MFSWLIKIEKIRYTWIIYNIFENKGLPKMIFNKPVWWLFASALIVLIKGQTDDFVSGPGLAYVGYELSNSNDNDLIKTYSLPTNSTSTEIYQTIQNAVDWLGGIGGGVLEMAVGEYRVNHNIYIRNSNIHFKGIMQQTILKLDDFVEPFSADEKVYGLLTVTSADNVKVSELTMDGNKENQYQNVNSTVHGLFAEASTHVWFTNVDVNNFMGYGIASHGLKATNQHSYNITMINCNSNNNDKDGVLIDQTEYAYIQNCYGNHNGRHGFNIVKQSINIILENIIATDNGFSGNGCGVSIQKNKDSDDLDEISDYDDRRTHDVLVQNSMLKNNYRDGICMNTVYDINIKGNDFQLNNRYSMYVANVVSANITQNTFDHDQITSKNSIIVYSQCNTIICNDVYVFDNIETVPVTSTGKYDETSGANILEYAMTFFIAGIVLLV